MSVNPPSLVVTVIVAVPSVPPVTTPFSTFATFSSLVFHFTFLFVAFSGVIVAIKFIVSVTFIVALLLSNDTPDTLTSSCGGLSPLTTTSTW